MGWLPKKSVVVPFDFSEHSIKALEAAPAFVADVANVHVVHVLQMITIGEPGMYFESIDNEVRVRHAQNAFRERLTDPPFDKIELHVRLGDPGREIIGFAEQFQAELIVMPSHGRTGLSRLLTGSVAEKVVRLAHCPVLILK